MKTALIGLALGAAIFGVIALARHQSNTPLLPRPNVCILAASNVDVEVQITNTSCAQDAIAFASDGLYWYMMPAGTFAVAGTSGRADGETMNQICLLHKNDSIMTVMDAGEAMYGTEICSSQEQGGWIG